MSPVVDNLSVFPFYGPEFDWDRTKPDWNSRKYWAFGQAYPFIVPFGYLPSAQFILPIGVNTVDNVSVFSVPDDSLAVALATTDYSIEQVDVDTKVFVLYSENLVFQPQSGPGPYYIVIESGDYSWYSDIFIASGDVGTNEQEELINPWTDRYLELSWWDEQNFITDDGIIVYSLLTHPGKFTQFKNKIYLPTDIGMPDYSFEEEGEERDGYFFPFKQISKKIYRFKFLAPEYLCDSLRLVRMSDHIEVRYGEHVYKATNFSPSFEWQDGGLLALVTVEFETNTVAKKIGWGKINN